MEINDYLLNYQPIIFKTFSNALINNKLSHAYFLSGSPGTPLKETALFLAKSILCDKPNPLACENCITCIRVDEGNYPDLMVFGSDDTKIKKGDIEKIINNFDKTALEEKGIMIYVLHLVETMTPIAVNSLLKFLEEPGKNVYAFLTTENETKILPTIISRTQVLRFREVDRNKVIKDAVDFGTIKEDAEMLSGFYNDPETIKLISESKDYVQVKDCIKLLLTTLSEKRSQVIYVNQSQIIPQIKTTEQARFFIKMLSEIFKDLININVNEPIVLESYANILIEVLPHLKNIDKSLLTLMSAIKKIDLNVNIALLLDHIVFQITSEEK